MAKVIYNNIIPFSGFKAITIFPFVFARKKFEPLDDKTLNHESIYLSQQLEVMAVAAVLMIALCLTCLSWWWMCAAPFAYYAWYCLEYVIRLFAYGRGHEAYHNICFEQEAFLNEDDFNYLPEDRRAFAWIRYLFRKSFNR